LGLKIIRGLLVLLGVLAAIVAALFWYYLYTPAPAVIKLPGDYKSESLTSDGIERSFSYYLPSTLQDEAALIFVLHGSTGSGDQVREQTGYEFDSLAQTHQFIPVYANGFENHWNDCRASADYSANTENIDDVSFIRQVIAVFVERHNIDPGKVFVTGHSNGGHMAYKLALEAPQLVRAIAPISASLPVDQNLDCEKSGLPIAVAIFNGTEDPVNPYGGGLVSIFGNASRGTVRSSLDTANYWANLAGANTELAPELIEFPELDGVASTSVTARHWHGDNGVDVRLYTLRGSGHVIPSKRVQFPRIIGPGAGDISGPEEIVMFFNKIAQQK
jgi:polyhydroxybutyrate depolymerase